MDALDFMNDPEAYGQIGELKRWIFSCDAVIILGERYHKLALEMAEKEADPIRKEEFIQIAANLEVVPDMHRRLTGRQSSYTVHTSGSYNRVEPMGCIQPGTS